MKHQKKQWLAFLLGGVLLGLLAVALVWRRNQRLIPYSYDSATTAVHQNLIGSWNYSAQAKTAEVQAQFGKDKQNAKLRISRDDSSLEFHLPLAQSQLTASEDRLHYSNAQNGQELRYQILPNGVKEEIILNQKPSSNIVTSQVFLNNLAGKVDSHSPRFYDKNNTYQFHFATPFVVDAKGERTDQVSYAFLPVSDTTNNANTNFTDVAIATQLESNKTYILAVIIDAQWLENKDRVYPLTIDPTVLHEDTPTVNVATHDNMRVGTQTPGIRFSATDPGNADLVYQVEWATDSSLAGSTTVSSDTGSGFSNLNTPADTSPFTSGESIQFVFPTLTNNTTYYYRIQSKVSGGSYDAWTSLRSLSVNTSQVDNSWYQSHSDQFSTDTYGSDIRIDTTNNLVYTRDTNVYTPIQVTNSGGTQTNYDVLLSLDTATLIAAGRMQADCDDLRFYDDEFYTNGFTYWIESGCNTSNTQVWVRIPSLPTGVTTLYTGYLNPGASAGSQSWTGNFIIPKTTTCPGGSTRFSTLDGYYPRGNSTYGGNAAATPHSHSLSGTTGTSGTGTNLYDTDAAQYVAPASHNHTYTGTAANTQNTPAYVETIFCSYSQLPATIATSDIILYSSLPANWTRNTTYDNRFPIGAATYGTTGGGAHLHSMSGSTSQHSMDTVGWVGTGSCDFGSFERYHTHTISGVNTDNTNALPPYYTMIYASPNSTQVLPSSAVVFFNTATLPPYGWTRFSALDTNFPYGSATAGTTGGATTHRHYYDKNTNTTSGANCVQWQSGGATIPASHTHTITGYTSYSSSLPAYFDMVFGQKKTDATTKAYLPEVNTVTDTITSTAINIANLSANPNWNQVTFNDVETYGDLKVQVAYDNGSTIVPIPDIDLASNSSGFDTSPIDISGLSATTYGTIYLKATIVSDGLNDQSAQLLDWEVDTVANPSPPSALFTEGQTNPTVTTFTPNLSAIYEDFEVNDQASNYQIQVSTNTIFTALIWDTGKTVLSPVLNRGARSTAVTYAGESLVQSGTYYWRIRFWDSHDLLGEWSPTGTFHIMDLIGPTNCVAVYNGGTNEVNVTWEDQDTQEENMMLEKLTEPGSFGALMTLNPNTLGYDDGSVTTNAVYQYRVRTVKDSIISPWCVTARVSSSIGTFMVN